MKQTSHIPYPIESIKDIENLIALKVKEDIKTVFKPAKEFDIENDKKLEHLSTIVSAIANTQGGYLFYGIECQRKKASTIDFVKITNNTIDQLTYQLNTLIHPAIEHLEIKCLFEENNNTNAIISIKIPNSSQAPHMANDRRFYKRTDNKEVLMDEFEIRNMYQRSKESELDIYAILNTNGIPTLENGKFQKVNFYPRFLIKNIGTAIENHYKLELHIPSGIYNPNFTVLQQHFSRLEDSYSVFSISNKSPLFQNELATILDANLIIDKDNFPIFETGEIIIKLYYSNGIKTKQMSLHETFLYQNKQLKAEDFCEQFSLFA